MSGLAVHVLIPYCSNRIGSAEKIQMKMIFMSCFQQHTSNSIPTHPILTRKNTNKNILKMTTKREIMV